MAVKRIQLRGISRSPSDRMTEDGGVAESLNVQLDNTEVAPSCAPEDVTLALAGLPLSPNTDVLIIHKVADKEICILKVVSGNQIIIGWNDLDTNTFKIIHTLNSEEEIKDVKAVGNTIIVATNKCLHYALYKGSKYQYIGNKLPFPAIEFFDAEVKAKKVTQIKGENNFVEELSYAYDLDIFSEDGAVVVDGLIVDQSGAIYDEIYPLTHLVEDYWNKIDKNSVHVNKGAIKTFNAVKAKWQQMIKENANLGVFSNSFWAVYALELFDQSLLVSTPQLLAPGEGEPLEVGVAGKWRGFVIDQYIGFNSFIIRLTKCFKLGLRLHDTSAIDFQPWRDIIKGIHIYISEDITSFDYVSMTPSGEKVDAENGNAFLSKMTLVRNTSESFISSALSKASFVKVEEFSLDPSHQKNIELLRNDYICDSRKYVLNEDRFSGRDLLSSKTYDIKQSTYTSDKLLVYNNKLNLLGSKETLSSGTKWFNAQRFSVYLPRPLFKDYPTLSFYPEGWFKNPWRDGEEILLGGHLFSPNEIKSMRIAYRVEDKGETAFVYGKTYQDKRDFRPIYTRYELNLPDVAALVIFPNPNCKYADIYINDGTTTHSRRVELRPHPYLPMCSYWYGGDMSMYNAVKGYNDFSSFSPENLYLEFPNKMVFADLNNPFIFPIGSAITFDSKIINAAVATQALSQGQFGQFPMYVFTEEGIMALEAAANGSVSAYKPLSRDVCVNANSVTSIDNAVVFVSDKGVMLLQGAQVTNLSPHMNGKHYVVEGTAQTIIKGQEFFSNLLPAMSDTTHFLAYVKNARVAYDYAGNRLIFIKEDEQYQYIYKLDTNTWHKTSYGALLRKPLNSYPECLVMGEKDGSSYIYDFSTNLDAAAKNIPTRGIIATRPFDLNEPDVLKTITDVRVRGQFPKGAVKFILLGSNDGINFYTLSTLRGRAWKLFRIILLADLDPTDRISWLDVQYETKFTNKLR